ncbi:YfkD family protein [Oceanobacillus sp. CAU 1775]
MYKNILVITTIAFINLFAFTTMSSAEEQKQEGNEFQIPSHVLDISQENTFSNETEDYEQIEASEQTTELIENANVKIKNADMIQLLNETTIKPSPIGIGYRGMIYLGRWPLLYESEETSINWEYQSINKNQLNNSSDTQQEMTYTQQENKEVKGALTSKIANPDTVRRMIVENAKEKTNLPLAFKATVGRNTKTPSTYQVAAQKTGHLEAYVPAVNEKGEITFGEVYIELKGTKKSLVVKNVTKQKIGAWLPIQDHVSYSFQLK